MDQTVTTAALIAAAGSAIASKELLGKLLGPTADYLGEGILGAVQKSQLNISRIVVTACHKLRQELNNRGTVSPRVLKSVCDEGRFVDDDIGVEYFAGMLASARTADGDESAIPFLTMLKALSCDSMRLHFIVYSLVARSPFSNNHAHFPDFWDGLELQIPLDELMHAMRFSGCDAEAQILLATSGLIDQNLLRQGFRIEESEFTAGRHEFPRPTRSLMIGPNERGARLFLRALGTRGLAPDLIASINVDFGLSDAVRSAIQMPSKSNLLHDETYGAMKELGDEVKEALSDFDDRISDVDDKVTDVESAIDELKSAVDELRDTADSNDDS